MSSLSPRIVFFGTPEFAVPTLRALVKDNFAPVAVVSQPAEPVGRKAVLTPSAITRVAQELKLPVNTPHSIKTPEFIDWFKKQNPDIAVLVAYGKILPKEVLEIPKKGFINLHPSLLPLHRGASPIAGAILAGDKITGVSIMILDEQMDHGPVLAKSTITIPPFSTTKTLSGELAQLGSKLLIEVLPKYISAEIKGQAQEHQKASFTKLLKKSSGLIDWSKSAQVLERQVRAFTPWPGSFTYLNQQRLLIHTAKIFNGVLSELAKEPGSLLIKDKKIFVRTGLGILEITSLQIAGKKIQKAQDFINGQATLSQAKLG